MRMHAAGRDQPDQVAGAAGAASAPRRVSTKAGSLAIAAVRDRVADPHQFLLDDAAGADVQMADLGVAHLPVRQADIAAGGVQERVRASLPQRREVRRRGRGGRRCPRTASRQPKPSRITSITGLGGMVGVLRRCDVAILHLVMVYAHRLSRDPGKARLVAMPPSIAVADGFHRFGASWSPDRIRWPRYPCMSKRRTAYEQPPRGQGRLAIIGACQSCRLRVRMVREMQNWRCGLRTFREISPFPHATETAGRD